MNIERLISQNNELITERDATRAWLVKVGGLLSIRASSGGDTIQENWALFRADILDALAGGSCDYYRGNN